MMTELLKGVLRNTLTGVGGSLVAGGYMSSSDWTAISGGIMAVAGVAWTLYHHSTTVPMPVKK